MRNADGDTLLFIFQRFFFQGWIIQNLTYRRQGFDHAQRNAGHRNCVPVLVIDPFFELPRAWSAILETFAVARLSNLRLRLSSSEIKGVMEYLFPSLGPPLGSRQHEIHLSAAAPSRMCKRR